MGLEVVVLGMSAAWAGPLAIAHGVMADGIEAAPVRGALRALGLAGEGPLTPQQQAPVVAVLAKAAASKRGRRRDYRQLDNSAIAA